jgi:hypothetical protein
MLSSGRVPLVLRLTLLVVLLLLNSVVPGFVVVRRFRWGPLETLVGSVAVSLTLIFLWTFALYLSGLPMRGGAAVGSVISAVLAAAAARGLGRLAAARTVRRLAVAFLLLLAWTLVLVALVRHFSGGRWGVDWLEHFHRCVFFLYRLPLDTRLHGDYHLTARPPFMNLLGTYFLAQVGDEFACFQLVFAFLNVLPFLSCALIARRLAPGGGRRLDVLLALFAACPLLIENAGYTWTKLLSAFFVILALDLYLRTLARPDGRRTMAWGLFMAAAILVHYSAAPFALFVAGHYFWNAVVTGSGARWIRALPLLAGALLLATWVGWAFATYGVRTTLTSNTSVGDARVLSPGQNLEKIALNIVDTVVPHPLRGVSMEPFRQGSASGFLRDYTFLMYQTNLIVAMGSVGGVLVITIAGRSLRRSGAGLETRFWRGFVPFVVVVAVATHGSRDEFGVAHVVLQPMVLLGVTLLAAAWPTLSRAARTAALMGSMLDLGLGIALHHHVESLENTPERTVFNADASLVTDGRAYGVRWTQEGFLPRWAWRNWYFKQPGPLLDRQLANVSAVSPQHVEAATRALRDERERLNAVDARDWAGWFSRHEGRTTFLGDHLAGAADLLRLAAAAMSAGILWTLFAAIGVSRPVSRVQSRGREKVGHRRRPLARRER